MNNKILLIGKYRIFLADKSMKKLNTQYGEIDLTKIRKYGQIIKTSKNHKFIAVMPSITDLLSRCKRGPQIVTPKDAAQIVASTGVSRGWKCLDAGSGSGFLSIFIGSIIAPDGRITTYEKNKTFYKNVKKNIKFCNLEKIVKAKNKSAFGFTEKNLDLITLDMSNAESMIPRCYKALKPGGWLVVYSPQIEQQKAAVEKMQNRFIQIHTIENIQRRWQVNNYKKGYTHPNPSGILHTGFLTFGRKC